MSTTVSYKGATIATVSNNTKTLLTEGKYLEDDLTLTDVSGGGSTLITKSISANGTYNASSDSADGYSQVTVAVPNTYTAGDEGKVVSSGALVSQTSKNINSNGTHSTVTNNQVVVAVPNSYSAGDEGKVVSNGALVAQTSDTVTANDTYDTTLINSLTVNVSGGSGVKKVSGSVTGNGTNDLSISTTEGKAPYIVILYRSDLQSMTAVSDRATAVLVCVENILRGGLYTSADSTSISNAGVAKDTGIGSAHNLANQVGYDNGRLYFHAGNNQNLFSTSITYNYDLYYTTT